MDEEVHRVLTDKVLPGQATVVSTHDFVKALAAKPERSGNKEAFEVSSSSSTSCTPI